MSPFANCLLATVLILGTVLWLFLLLGSLLFAPPSGTARMRFIEKALLFVSILLLLTWISCLLAYGGKLGA